MKNFRYHFEAEKGWINDPNGLACYNGKIHVFYQHNPYSVKWDRMHWGHAVTEDFIHFEELPIALWPDMEYESGGGCFSGSAIVMDDLLHIYYTAVDKDGIQSVCHAVMNEDNEITKDKKNPLFIAPSGMNPKEFRDPKITVIDGHYYMAVGASHEGCACVCLYEMKDPGDFTYLGILYQNGEYGAIMECPDFFKLGDKYVLSVSLIGKNPGTRMLVGEFHDNAFLMEDEYSIEEGMTYYAAQSFLYEGRRIQLGWCRDVYVNGSESAGCMAVPRELHLKDGRLFSYPVSEALALLKDSDLSVAKAGNGLYYENELFYEGEIRSLEFLRDNSLLEVFINHGEKNFIFFREERENVIK